MENTDEYGRSKLHYVCIDHQEEDRMKIFNLLMKERADVNQPDNNGWSPLHFAAQVGDVNITQALIKAGANIHQEESNGNTPLWIAVMNSYRSTPVIELLRKNGADEKHKNKHGVSAVDIFPEVFENEI